MRFLLAIGVIATTHSYAQQVAATSSPTNYPTSVYSSNRAPLQMILPNSYGVMSINHYLDVKPNPSDENKFSQNPMMDVRYTLGSTFFSGDLNSSITFGAQKEEKTTIVSQRRTNVYSELVFVKTELFYLGPYLDLWLPLAGSNFGTQGDLGLFSSVSTSFPTETMGIFFGDISIDGAGIMASRESYIPVTGSRRDLTLESRPEQTTLVEQETPNLKNSAGVGFGWSMANKVWKVQVKGYYDRMYSPKIIVDEASTEGVTEEGYVATSKSQTRTSIEWQVTPQITIANIFYQNFHGAFETQQHSTNPIPYTNLVRLSVSLF